ncbi:helix-turn-helix domain-containing protein [Sphingobacterium deserti]|uniref:Helix-turn-helix domain-containing protein n=2 Tax=Sphingobacterium deserti TaxID=1229276 RepID=A0A0B8T5Y4_9SPHI|nr:helix-turn-helix domain-containing protein [Sphingobacterium deserti]
MVCARCKMVVETAFQEAGLKVVNVELGSVQVADQDVATEQLEGLEQQLESLGFSLLTDSRLKDIESIKTCIIALVHSSNNALEQTLSVYLSNRLHKDYATLSTIFSQHEPYTIEKYFIRQKIERVKELLSYDELNLKEIAYRLNYSSVAHLSSQFKKVTGYTPSAFKKTAKDLRQNLDQL